MKLTEIEEIAFSKAKLDVDTIKGVFMFGTTGTGKTTICRALSRKYGNKIYNVTDLYSLVRDNGTSFIEDLSKKRCLCIDDIYEIKDQIFFGSTINIIEELLLKRFDHLETIEHNLKVAIDKYEVYISENEYKRVKPHFFKEECERLLAIVNNWKDRSNCITIITTNLTIDEFVSQISSRVFDRIKKHMTFSCMTGESYRN